MYNVIDDVEQLHHLLLQLLHIHIVGKLDHGQVVALVVDDEQEQDQ